MPKPAHPTPSPADILTAAVPHVTAAANEWPGTTFPVWRCLHRGILDAARAAAPEADAITIHTLTDACAYALMRYMVTADLTSRGWGHSAEPTWQHLGHTLLVWRSPDKYMRNVILTDLRHLLINAAAHERRVTR